MVRYDLISDDNRGNEECLLGMKVSKNFVFPSFNCLSIVNSSFMILISFGGQYDNAWHTNDYTINRFESVLSDLFSQEFAKSCERFFEMRLIC